MQPRNRVRATGPLRFLFIGEQTLPRTCMEKVLAAGHDIAGLITRDKDLRIWAESRGIYTSSAGTIAEQIAFASAQAFDYLFSIVNGSIVPDELIALAVSGAINFHDGPLPEYAGFFTTTHALLRGAAFHGITWHRMERRLDAGSIVKQVRFPLSADETAFTLNAKCYEAAIQSFQELLAELDSGTIIETPQDFGNRAYYARYRRPWAACGLDLELSPEKLSAFCRALDFGPYPNPFGSPLLWNGNRCVIAPAVRTGSPTTAIPGTVTRLETDLLAIAAGGAEAVFTKLLTTDGQPVSVAEAAGILGIEAGSKLAKPNEPLALEAARLASSVSRYEPFWVDQLVRLRPLHWEEPGRISAAADGSAPRVVETLLPQPASQSEILATLAACLAYRSGETDFHLGYAVRMERSLENVFAAQVPLAIQTGAGVSLGSLGERLAEDLIQLEQAQTYTRSLPSRYPALQSALSLPVYPIMVDCHGTLSHLSRDAKLVVSIAAQTGSMRWIFDPAACSEESIRALSTRFSRLLASADRSQPIADLPYLDVPELQRILSGFNQTDGAIETDVCVHSLFERWAEREPDRIAVTFEAEAITYGELNCRANRLAAYLRARGIGPESRVAVSMRRSIELVVALLGVLKAGAAYVPVDPSYPAARVAFVLEDCGAAVVLTRRADADLPVKDLTCPVVHIDDYFPGQSSENADSGVRPENLCYLIYTSGSTGKPKGVMVEHRNVVNFFAGMDRELGTDPGTWLAVTSISFDISVLELFWTLARGFHVVLAREGVAIEPERPAAGSRKALDFSLFYFSGSAGEANPYRLLLEGARFADNNGFTAVWTPERHFHDFGGLYPNPAVTSAAVAAVTSRVQIRAGSVVVPLHHPARIAEDWAVIDNLSNGRAAISIAPGWNERDFIFAPGDYRQAKQVMVESTRTVQALWRGESVRFRDGKGADVEIRTMPRPVQKELPVWVTAAGNPDTFRTAGAMGANLLTHLLGQTLEQLADKIRVYREARREAGFDPETGHVTVMLHTFVGDTLEEVRDTVREPMKNYLKTSVDLIRNSPWSFPVFVKRSEDGAQIDLNALSAEEMDALLEHSFLRYFETSGLFGTVEGCTAIAERVGAIGANEIACLIDFGVPAERVLQGLHALNAVRARLQQPEQADDFSLPSLIRRHGVTHFQCTPSMASMITATPEAKDSLAALQHMLVGGEALTPALAGALVEATGGTVHNMYGPTETTIWSTTQAYREPSANVTIGRPMLNTQVYVLDAARKPVAIGNTGELYIGGLGVTRGYWARPELTAERFPKNPFGSGLLYRTGDLVRFTEDGTLDFLGRADQQVKIRGYRIELNEIEAVLSGHPNVREAVVTPHGASLAAYVTAVGEAPAAATLRAWLSERLPEYMIPSAVVTLPSLPRTPNGKLDRKALPSPASIELPRVIHSAPQNEMEALVARVLEKALGTRQIGLNENFFDLGAHSLLMVQVRNELQNTTGRPVSLIALFQFPTVRTLAAHLDAAASAGRAPITGLEPAASDDRGQRRKEALEGRLLRRQKVVGAGAV